MSMYDLLPWSHKTPAARANDRDAVLSLHQEMNRLFDDALRGFDLPGFGRAGWPNVEIADGEREITVTAEIPGVSEKDVEVLFADGVLTLKGEKRSETEDKDKRFSERVYGSFERRIPMPAEVEPGKIAARFKDGVLTVTLPKTERAQTEVTRIPIDG